MSFPEWAPAVLIEQYKRLQVEVDFYRKKASEEQERVQHPDELDEEFKTPNYGERLRESEKLISVLYRLLTYPGMNSVWAAVLVRPPADPKPWKNEPAYFLWTSIARALKDFPLLMENARTRAEMRKSLLSIASKAKALQDSIGENAVAEAYANELVAAHLTRKNLEARQENGENPIPAEFDMPLTLKCDCSEAFQKKEVRDLFFGYKWHDTPLLARLAYWVREAKDTGLLDLLQLFTDILHKQANVSPEIKQPGRSAEAMRPFIIRRISDWLFYYYGQRLDDTVAQIVSVVLNLDTPLTRDDIRPYVITTGKKMT